MNAQTADLRLVGRDLHLDYHDGLLSSTSGDVVLIEGLALLQKAIVRRLLTPPWGMARWIRTPEGPRLIDETYGNGAYNYLASPLELASVRDIQEAISNCLSYELRINVQKVDFYVSGSTTVEVEVFYKIKGQDDLESVRTRIVLPDAVNGE